MIDKWVSVGLEDIDYIIPDSFKLIDQVFEINVESGSTNYTVLQEDYMVQDSLLC